MRLETYREMSKFVGQEVGSLGVCNFSHRQLLELLEFCDQEGLEYSQCPVDGIFDLREPAAEASGVEEVP